MLLNYTLDFDQLWVIIGAVLYLTSVVHLSDAHALIVDNTV